MSFRRLFLPLLLLAGLASAAPAQEFPLTLEHAYGETTIPAKPVRVVTWGWANEDAVIALA